MVTHSVHSTLNSIGGIQVLFPLFAQLDLPSSEPTSAPSTTLTTGTPTATATTTESNEPTSANSATMSVTHGGTKDQSLW